MMPDGRILLLTLLFFIYIQNASSLRNVRLEVKPPVILRSNSAEFHCLRDMQNAQLYSVKWYRGTHEFYRYNPMEEPKKKHFGIPGIFVDMNNSNDSVVVLRHLDLGLAGSFSCEVTAEFPYSTQVATAMVNVIAPPTTGPVMKTNKQHYQPNDILWVNCSISPAKPPANLTIYVNEEPYNSYETRLLPYRDNGFFSTSVKMRMLIGPEHFIGGRFRLSCAATILDAYRTQSSLDFFTPETDPRPERITFSSSPRCCLSSWILMLFLLILPMLVRGEQSLDYLDALSEMPNYDEENYKDMFVSFFGG